MWSKWNNNKLIVIIIYKKYMEGDYEVSNE